MANSATNTESRFILWRILDVLEKIFCIVPVIAMTAVVAVSVFMRYVLKMPFGWSEEFTLVCMVWCVFGAASYAFYHGLNVGVTFLVDRVHGKSRHIVEILILTVTIIFLGVLLYTGFSITLNGMGKFTTAAHIPLVIPYSAIPVGCAMSILRLIELAMEEVKKMRSSSSGESISET